MEQVRQLEARVAKVIDYVTKVTDEKTLLKNKLDSYQKRIDELEVLIQRFREDQGRIEEGIVSALERLNQFEDDIQKTISPVENSAPVNESVINASAGDSPDTVPENSSETEIADEKKTELDIF
jgi:chromosome segregation ATPase